MHNQKLARVCNKAQYIERCLYNSIVMPTARHNPKAQFNRITQRLQQAGDSEAHAIFELQALVNGAQLAVEKDILNSYGEGQSNDEDNTETGF